jgi:hypothetical protein
MHCCGSCSAASAKRSAGPSFHYGFNLPAGACLRYDGGGTVSDIDLDQLFDEASHCPRGRQRPRIRRGRLAGSHLQTVRLL